MIDQELKTLLERQFGRIDEHFGRADEQFEAVLRTTKEGFDEMSERFNAVDERFKTIEADIAFLKERVAAIADEVQTLSVSMVTKQYLDARIEAHLGIGEQTETKMEAMRQTIFALMLLLEKHQLLPSEQRARYEALLT